MKLFASPMYLITVLSSVWLTVYFSTEVTKFIAFIVIKFKNHNFITLFILIVHSMSEYNKVEGIIRWSHTRTKYFEREMLIDGGMLFL